MYCKLKVETTNYSGKSENDFRRSDDHMTKHKQKFVTPNFILCRGNNLCDVSEKKQSTFEELTRFLCLKHTS